MFTDKRSNSDRDTADPVPLVRAVGVLAEVRAGVLVVQEPVAGLAQQHEPARLQVLVVCGVHVMHVEILHARVVLPAEVARLVVGSQHVLAEQQPLRGEAKGLVLLAEFFKVFSTIHVLTVVKFLRSRPQ